MCQKDKYRQIKVYVSVFREEVRCWQTGTSVHHEMLCA